MFCESVLKINNLTSSLFILIHWINNPVIDKLIDKLNNSDLWEKMIGRMITRSKTLKRQTREYLKSTSVQI